MKIVMIHGQNHQGNSCNMGRYLTEQITGEKEITEFFLPKDLDHFCTGCLKCLDKEEVCPFYEEKRKILQVVEEAEVLVFTTPTYCMHASAPMKSFLDLTFSLWMVHRPKACMFGKKAVILSTAAGNGTESAIKDIKTALTFWGIPWIRTCGAALQASDWDQVSEKKKASVQKKLKEIAEEISKNKMPHVGIKTKFLFGMMRKMQKSGMGSSISEKEYWENNGWLGGKRPWKI